MTRRTGTGPDDLPADSIVGAWAEEAHATAAAESRRRTRWLTQQAVEQATIADLLGSGCHATLHTLAGRHGGLVKEVGLDYVLLAGASGAIHVASTAILAVEVDPSRAGGPQGDGVRPPAMRRSLGAALAAFAASETVVHVATAGPSVVGELAVVAEDFVVVRPDAIDRPPVCIPLAAVLVVSVSASTDR